MNNKRTTKRRAAAGSSSLVVVATATKGYQEFLNVGSSDRCHRDGSGSIGKLLTSRTLMYAHPRRQSMCLYVLICLYMCMCMPTMHMYMYNMYMSICICTYVCIYVCMYVCMYVIIMYVWPSRDGTGNTPCTSDHHSCDVAFSQEPEVPDRCRTLHSQGGSQS